MKENFKHSENQSLVEIFNSIYLSEYNIIDLNNIQIISDKVKDKTILVSEIEVGNNVYNFLSSKTKNKKILFEPTIIDFYIVSNIDENINESFTMSLIEYLFSEGEKEFDINEQIWSVIESNYDLNEFSINLNSTDAK